MKQAIIVMIGLLLGMTLFFPLYIYEDAEFDNISAMKLGFSSFLSQKWQRNPWLLENCSLIRSGFATNTICRIIEHQVTSSVGNEGYHHLGEDGIQKY